MSSLTLTHQSVMPHLNKLSCLAGLAVAASYYSDLCVKQTWEKPTSVSDPMCCFAELSWAGRAMSDGSPAPDKMSYFGVEMYDSTADDAYDILTGIDRYRCVFPANPYVCAHSRSV